MGVFQFRAKFISALLLTFLLLALITRPYVAFERRLVSRKMNANDGGGGGRHEELGRSLRLMRGMMRMRKLRSTRSVPSPPPAPMRNGKKVTLQPLSAPPNHFPHS
ncbi:hypothetical protein PIB30_021319 [Stylosanthes scabra]|uniref:Uncharacterized protein n=1 Tax=Stylosanthes scabra TaxID=79078 RepID=A0ABU6Z5G1_9FABA|nr:hypothetical protein [Stylosanthes scabra]